MIINYLMRKLNPEPKGCKREAKIKFNLSACNLACFKSPSINRLGFQDFKDAKDQKVIESKQGLDVTEVAPNSMILKRKYLYEGREKTKSRTSFNQRVVFMYYDDKDVYIDESAEKKSGNKKSKEDKRKVSHSSDGSPDQFVSECVRVLTEQTDNTSNPLSLKLTPRENQMCYYDMNWVNRPVRNRRAVTVEESKAYVIDFKNIEADGRTTVMVKNIPNKYTQQLLLEEFSVNHENQFDFFYLPIDKDNNCNVGYAFVNFINPSYLKSFFQEFHMKKWKKYKSPKICNISYARYQGTLELANHFRHTKILQQKDKKLKPLIGLNQAKIEEIVKIQQGKQ